LRKSLIAILAVPVLLGVYAAALLGRSRFVRGGVAIGLGAIVALGAISFSRPSLTTASPVSDIVPLTQAAFKTAVSTNIDLIAPATIMFSTPMERESVEAAVSVQPSLGVSLLWNDDATSVSIVPDEHWAPSTYYTVSVGPGALATTGRPMTQPVRAAFLTRDATSASVAATSTIEKRVAIDSAFTIAFDQAVDLGSVAPSIRLDPPAPGALSRTLDAAGLPTYTFKPSAPLLPDTRYRLIVTGARDAAGAEVATTAMAVRTVKAPAVVRFRPRTATTDVARDAAISVRFTQQMDRASTKKAFKVSAAGKAVSGTVRFAENDTVLIFDPSSNLPYGARITATVAATAKSTDGVALGAAAKGTFRVAPKPVATTRTISSGSGGGSGGGGGSVGGGSWAAVERYYLNLMNCTRTGGLVTSGGDCSSPGGRSVAPLRLDAGISSKVARPYAKKLAVNNMCTHFSGGNPGDRLRRAGYSSYRWAENLGCRSGNPYGAVLGSHRYFQSERSWSPPGGHYVNLMNSAYDRVGIGVWVSGGRVRLVVDFYHP
jgi:uncharacterized protein YkwD